MSALCVGRYMLSVDSVFNALFGINSEDNAIMVVQNVRLPRILLAIIVGGGLSVAGCTFQAVFANPLASPDTLGVSSGAAFGAALGILMFSGAMMIQSMALIFGEVIAEENLKTAFNIDVHVGNVDIKNQNYRYIIPLK